MITVYWHYDMLYHITPYHIVVDCSTVTSKLQFLMDDLLWILTDSQTKAAAVFARHMKHQIDKASEQSKRHMAKEFQVLLPLGIPSLSY